MAASSLRGGYWPSRLCGQPLVVGASGGAQTTGAGPCYRQAGEATGLAAHVLWSRDVRRCVTLHHMLAAPPVSLSITFLGHWPLLPPSHPPLGSVFPQPVDHQPQVSPPKVHLCHCCSFACTAVLFWPRCLQVFDKMPTTTLEPDSVCSSYQQLW